MKVGIIGAGSIGLLFAAYISKVLEVTIYTRTPKQAAEINKNGIMLKVRREQTVSSVKALSVSKWTGVEDLTIITVKQYQLQTIIEQINQLPLIPNNLLFLQNGMAHLKQLKTIPFTNTFVGSVEHGALKENSFTVSHNGEGTTNIAVFKGDSSFLEEFLYLAPLDFPLAMKEDYYKMLLDKLIVNAVINPLTAILQVKNGELIKNQHYFHVVKNLFSEIASILNLKNIEEQQQRIIDICNNTSDNRSSMLKDIEANRKTEVDAILGFILEEAQNKDIQSPQIESLYYLIKGKEMKKGGNILSVILSSIISIFFTVPFLGFIIVFFVSKFVTKNTRKSVHKALDFTTILFIISVHFLIVTILGKSLIWLIILVMIVIAMVFVFVHWKVKEEIILKTVMKGFWRFIFLLFLLAYITLTLYGLVHRALIFTFSN